MLLEGNKLNSFSNLTFIDNYILSLAINENSWVTEMTCVILGFTGPHNRSLGYVQNHCHCRQYQYYVFIGPLIFEKRHPLKIWSWHRVPLFE